MVIAVLVILAIFAIFRSAVPSKDSDGENKFESEFRQIKYKSIVDSLMLCSLQQRDTAFVDISEKSGPATLAVFGYSITKVYDLDQSGDGVTTTIR